MIQHHNVKSLALGLPGVVAQFAGFVVATFHPEHETLGTVLAVVGGGLLVAGIGFYAVAKGRHPAWCRTGFLGLIGLIVLGLLEDRSAVAQTAAPATPRRDPKLPEVAPPSGPLVFPASDPGHVFNAYGVCTKCGCGRSAGDRPCRP